EGRDHSVVVPVAMTVTMRMIMSAARIVVVVVASVVVLRLLGLVLETVHKTLAEQFRQGNPGHDDTNGDREQEAQSQARKRDHEAGAVFVAFAQWDDRSLERLPSAEGGDRVHY